MKLFPRFISIIALSMSAMLTAHADDNTLADETSAENFSAADLFRPHSVYVEGNIGFSVNSAFDDPWGFNDVHSSDYGLANGPAYGVNVGVEFSRYLALETGFMQHGQSDAGLLDSQGTSYLEATQDLYAFHLSVKGTLPLGQSRYSLFVKNGVAYTVTEAHVKGVEDETDFIDYKRDSTGYSFIFGTGLAYDITDSMVANIQWSRIFDIDQIKYANDFNADMFTIGFAYKYLFAGK